MPKRKSIWIIESTCIKGNYSNHVNHKEHPKLEVIAESIYEEETTIIYKTYFSVNYKNNINKDIKLNLTQPVEGTTI